MTGCPTDQELESLIEDRIAPLESPPEAPTRASSLLTHHLEVCERCRVRIDELERDRVFMHEIVSALSDVSDPGTTGRSANPTVATLSIPGYEIDGELHRGAQGVVFKAHQRSTNRKVALKVLYHESGTSLRMRQRFLREIELAAQLRHPNVVTIFDSGETADGRLYFAMEFVDGPRLDVHAAALAQSAKKSPSEYRRQSLRLFDSVCAGVAHAHQHGVMHRDLKPGNILLGRDGEPKVLDFGLAKATDADVNRRFALDTIAGSFMGTIAYASPEQTRGNPDGIDTRSDVYALGVLLHELVTGRLPYDVTGSLSDGIDNVLNAQPQTPLRWRTPEAPVDSQVGPGVDRDLETIVLKALAKEPARRYPTVDALREDIAHYLAGRPIVARRDSLAYVVSRHGRRHRMAIGVLLLLFGLAATTYVLSQNLFTAQEAARTAVDTAELYAAQLAQQEMWDATSGAAREPGEGPPDAAAIDRDARVVINAPEAPVSLNPTYMRRGDLFVCEMIFERLFWRTVDLELVPNPHLIESIEEAVDPTIKTIRLHPDLTWHDGEALTAADIEYSWRKTIAPEVRSTKRQQASRIKDIRIEDDQTLTIQFESAHATWRLSANFELIPRHLFEPGEREDPTLRESEYYRNLHQHPVGSGPYRFESWGEDAIELRRFQDYHEPGAGPHVGALTIRWIESPEAKLAAFFNNSLDLFELTEDQYRSQIYTEAFEAAGREARRPSSRYHYVVWNCRQSEWRLDDPEVRRALAMAINVDRIKSEVTNNLAAACFGPWLSGSPYADPGARRLAYRPAAARSILEEAFKGEPLPSLTLLVSLADESDMKSAAIIGDCLENVGIQVTIEAIGDTSQLLARLREGGFDACLMGSTPGVDPERQDVEFVKDGKLNFGGYENPKVDQLFTKAARSKDEAHRIRIFREIHRIVLKDQPRTYLYNEPALWAVGRRLSGVTFSCRGPYNFQPGILNWWVGENAEK